LIPTGASDPYALRRQGIGVLQIMLDKQFDFSVRELIQKGVSLYGEMDPADLAAKTDEIGGFLRNRISHMLAVEGFSKDVIAAVVSVSADRVPDVWNRVKALEKLKKEPDFDALAAAFKRVVNIIKKADVPRGASVDAGLFEHDSETALNAAYDDVREKVVANLEKGLLDQALLDIASLRNAVD
ncbi:MAG: glycine--tRNA ligase subunit beta, partial [Desulfobacterales bacterium]|nr:glycine--tRNA ligase subunit beta [Desulfobacterales bacterium]